MVDSAVNLSIGTELDLSGFRKGLQSLRETAINVDVKLNFDQNKLNNLAQKFKSMAPDLHLAPTVDLSDLHELNRLLDIKQEHLRATQAFFDANPLTVRANASELTDLQQSVEKMKAVKPLPISFPTKELAAAEAKINAATGEAKTNAATKEVANIEQQQLKTLEEIAQNTKQPAEVKGGLIQGAVQGVGQGLAFQASRRTAEGLIDGAEEVLGKTLTEVGQDVGRTAVKATQEITAKAVSLQRGENVQFKDVQSEAKSKVQRAKEAVKSPEVAAATKQAQKQAGQVWKDINKIYSAFSTAMNAVVAGDRMKGGAQRIVDKKNKNLKDVNQLKNQATSFSNNVKQAISAVKTAIDSVKKLPGDTVKLAKTVEGIRVAFVKTYKDLGQTSQELNIPVNIPDAQTEGTAVTIEPIQEAVNTVVAEASSAIETSSTEVANDVADAAQEMGNTLVEAIDSVNDSIEKAVDELAEFLSSSVFSSEGLRKLSRQMGYTRPDITTESGSMMTKKELATKIAAGITLDNNYTRKDLEKEIKRLGNGIRNKSGYDIDLPVQPVLSQEKFEMFTQYLKDRYKEVSDTFNANELSLEGAETLGQEIDAIVNSFKELEKAVDIPGDASRVFNGQIQAFKNMSAQIDTIKNKWKSTEKSVSKNIKSIGDVAEKEGSQLPSKLADNSPGPTWIIRKKWKQTAEFVAKQIQKMGSGASRAGSETAKSLVGKLNEIPDRVQKIADKIKSFLKNLSVGLVGAFVLQKIFDTLGQLSRETFATARDFESLKLALDFSTIEGGVKTLDRIFEYTTNLGASFREAAEGFKQLSAATQGTSLEGQTQNILEGLTSGIAVRGLTSDQQQRAFIAISQIASKGRVSLEELTGQLAEALPGALQVSARAFGVTTAELIKMVEAGQVTGDDFLPKFIAQLALESRSSVAGAANTATSRLAAFENQVFKLKRQLGDALLAVTRVILPAINSSLDFLNNNLDKVIAAVVALGFVVTKNLLSAFLLAIAEIGPLTDWLKKLGLTLEKVKLESGKSSVKLSFAQTSFKNLGAAAKALVAEMLPVLAVFAGFNAIKTVLTPVNTDLAQTSKGFQRIAKDAKNAQKQAQEGAKEFKTTTDELREIPKIFLQTAIAIDKLTVGLSFGYFKREESTLIAESFLEISKQARNAEKAVKEAKAAFKPLSKEDTARLREIDTETKRLNIELNVAREQGRDTSGIQDQIDALQDERSSIIQTIAGYSQLVDANDKLIDAVANLKKQLEDGRISQSEYNRELAFLEDQQSQIGELLDQYADSTGTITANVRELAFNLNRVSRELAQARVEAEKTVTAAQLELIQGRLTGDVSASDFARGQTQIATEKLQTIADDVSSKVEETRKEIEKTLNSDAGLRGQVLTALAGAKLSMNELIDSGTQADIEKLRDFFTKNGELDGPGGVILAGLEQLIQLRDESMATGKELAEQELQAREQIFDLLNQEIDLRQEKLNSETLIADAKKEIEGALSSFEQETLRFDAEIKVKTILAEDYAAAAQQPGLLNDDKERLERLAEETKVRAKLLEVQKERAIALDAVTYAVEQQTAANDIWYATQQAAIEAQQGFARGSENISMAAIRAQDQLLRTNVENTNKKLLLNWQELEAYKNLRENNKIDDREYTREYNRLTKERIQIFGEAYRLQQEASSREVEAYQRIIDMLRRLRDVRSQVVNAQMQGLDVLTKAQDNYNNALGKQGELIQAQARITKVSQDARAAGFDQEIVRLEKIKQNLTEQNDLAAESAAKKFEQPTWESARDYAREMEVKEAEAKYAKEIAEVEERIRKVQLEAANEKAKALAEEQQVQRQLLAVEIERAKIASQMAIKQAEIAAIRAKGSLDEAAFDVKLQESLVSKGMADPVELLRAQAAFLSAQQQYGLSLAEYDIAKQSAVLDDRLGEMKKQALLAEQGVERNQQSNEFRSQFGEDTSKALSQDERKALRQKQRELERLEKITQREIDKQILRYGEQIIRNPFRDFGSTNDFGFGLDGDVQGMIDVGSSLENNTQSDAFEKLLQRIDQSAMPLEKAIQDRADQLATANKLNEGIDTLNAKIQGLIQAVGRPNITITGGGTSLQEAIDAMRYAN